MNKGGHPENCTVKITKNFVLKKYCKNSHKEYVNELFFYLLSEKKKLNYIPELIDYNPVNRTLKTKNVGIPIDQYCSDNEIDIDTFLPQIKSIYNKFRAIGYYHNDLRYKNILINEFTKKIYLIDFEYTDIVYTDKDDQEIIKKINSLKSKSKSKSKSKKKSKKS